MRWALLFSALMALTCCTSSGMSDYNNPDAQSNSSLMGAQGGAGLQAPIWSDDPGKSTLTHQGPSQ